MPVAEGSFSSENSSEGIITSSNGDILYSAGAFSRSPYSGRSNVRVTEINISSESSSEGSISSE